MDKLNEQAQIYFKLQAQIAELEAQAEAIKDFFKAQMVEATTEELKGAGWSATWHNVNSSRFNSKAFKAQHKDLYEAFTIKGVSTRFTLTATKA